MSDWSRRVTVAVFVGLTLCSLASAQRSVVTPAQRSTRQRRPVVERAHPERAENPWLSDTIDVHSHFVALSEDARSGDLSWDRSSPAGYRRCRPVVAAVPLPPAAGGGALGVVALRVLVAGGFLADTSAGGRHRPFRAVSPPTASPATSSGGSASVKRRRIRTRLVVVGRVAGVGATTAVPCPPLRRSPRSTSRTSRSLPPMS